MRLGDKTGLWVKPKPDPLRSRLIAFRIAAYSPRLEALAYTRGLDLYRFIPAMSAFLDEEVLSVHHWTDRLFSFTTTRDTSLRFSNGHFTMIGLRGENGKPLLRAYSIVSANYEEHLEFLSIKVPDGPLTSKLQHIKVIDATTGRMLINVCGVIASTSCVVIRSRTTRSIRESPIRTWF